MKLGLDLHGVIDADPVSFARLSRDVIAARGEVHVITGSLDTPKLHEQLKGYGLSYTHIFSIASHYEALKKVWYDDCGNPWTEASLWDRAKAEYCAREKIDLHIDDSEFYGQYFTTPYFLYHKE